MQRLGTFFFCGFFLDGLYREGCGGRDFKLQMDGCFCRFDRPGEPGIPGACYQTTSDVSHYWSKCRYAHQNQTENMKFTATTKVNVAVELGSPAADCAHFGICSMELLPPEQWAAFCPRHIRHLKALVALRTASLLWLEFPFEGMLHATHKKFFPDTGFRVDSGTAIPLCLAEALQLTREMQTMPGLYPLEFSQEGASVGVALQPVKRRLAVAT